MSTFADLPNNFYQQIPRHAVFHVLKIELNIKKLEDIIRTMIREHCDVSVMGFNSTENFYWCKIEQNKKCMLYTEIKLFANDYDSSLVVIINDNDTNLKYKGQNSTIKNKFINNLSEGFYLYQTSSFSRHYIESCCS